MTKERQYKKEIKKLDRILYRIEKKEQEKRRESFREYIENYKKHNEYIFEVLSLFYEAKRIIDNSKYKEKHKNPNPFLGRHLGLYTKSSEELKRIGIKDNHHLINSIILRSIMNYILNDYVVETFDPFLNSRENNLNFEEKISRSLKLILNQIGEFKLKNKKKETEIIINCLENILKENFSIEPEQIQKFLIYQLEKNGQALAETIENMKNYENYEKHYIKEMIEEIENLVNFNLVINFFRAFKEKMNVEGKIYIEERGEKTFYDYNDLYYIALKNCKNLLEQIALNVDAPIEIGKNINNFSFHDIFFRNDVLEYYEFLKNFIQQNSDKVKTKDETFYNDLEETLKRVDEIVENKKESFSAHLGSLQDMFQQMVFENAEKKDKNYYKCLNEFIKFSIQYSKVLEENDDELLYLLNICEPDSHIIVNEMAAKKTMIKYATSKMCLKKEKLEKLSLSQIYNLLHEKQKKDYHKKNKGISMDEIFANYKLPLYNALYERFNNKTNLVRVVLDSKLKYMKAKREKGKEKI